MKRVLIIAYFFPPISNMGSHRMLRFVRHLYDFGWEPVVLTGVIGGWSTLDEHLLSQVPANIHLYRVGNMDMTHVWNKFMKRNSSNVPHAIEVRISRIRS